jgi:hypothetical protein
MKKQVLFVCLMLFVAITANAQSQEGSASLKKVSDSNLKPTISVAHWDNLPARNKKKIIKNTQATLESKAMQCGECKKLCCKPCFADDITNCAETKFEDCAQCKHKSNKHALVKVD